MAMSINKVFITGRVIEVPYEVEGRHRPFVRCRVTLPQSRPNQRHNNDWVLIEATGRNSERILKGVRQGAVLTVEGRLCTNTFDNDKDQSERLVIRVDNFTLNQSPIRLEGPASDQQSESPSEDSGSNENSRSRRARRRKRRREGTQRLQKQSADKQDDQDKGPQSKDPAKNDKAPQAKAPKEPDQSPKKEAQPSKDPEASSAKAEQPAKKAPEAKPVAEITPPTVPDLPKPDPKLTKDMPF